MWDLFISHASEDKERVARPLAKLLSDSGLTVWFDEHSLRLGDSLRRKIDEGLSGCRFGLVILSPHFIQKEWPTRELDALFLREDAGEKVILPIWHNLSKNDVAKWSPLAATKLAADTSKGLDEVVRQILEVVRSTECVRPVVNRIFRFRDYVHADPVSVKVALSSSASQNEGIDVRWPVLQSETLNDVTELLADAARYHEPESKFNGVDPEAVINFIKTAESATSYAHRVMAGVPLRIDRLVAGMARYWGDMSFLKERAVSNFLTLASFEVQFRLTYCYRFIAIADRMPKEWLGWYEPERGRLRLYGELFEIDDEIANAMVSHISNLYLNRYIWGPRWMLIEGLQSNEVIANPWFVNFLIPQAELALAEQHDKQTIEYCERATVQKVLDELGNEIY